jgi:DNA-directed RNA polymerase subunit alpha
MTKQEELQWLLTMEEELLGEISELMGKLKPVRARLADLRAEQVAWDTVPIEELELTIRAYNVLKANGINTVAELAGYSRPKLLAMKGFGRLSLGEVRDALHDRGLNFAREDT